MRYISVSLFIVMIFFVSLVSAKEIVKEIKKDIPPGKVHEECMKLNASKKLAYSFKSKSPLNFNIHYHLGKDVFYPIKRDKVKAAKEEFRPTSQQEYCLMWSNPEKTSVNLSYTYKVEE